MKIVFPSGVCPVRCAAMQNRMKKKKTKRGMERGRLETAEAVREATA